MQIKLAAAEAAFANKYTDGLRGVVWRIEPYLGDEMYESTVSCVVCGSNGVAEGEASLEETVNYEHDRSEPDVYGWLKFTATSFSCQVCGLRLASKKCLWLACGLSGSIRT